jgi:hypothetical protein
MAVGSGVRRRDGRRGWRVRRAVRDVSDCERLRVRGMGLDGMELDSVLLPSLMVRSSGDL